MDPPEEPELLGYSTNAGRGALKSRLAVSRRPMPPAVEAMATAAVGGALAGVTWSFVGLGLPAAAIGTVNGLISGARGTYHWRTPSGWLAFALDSTWAVPMTAAAAVAHGVALVSPRQGGYFRQLSRRANRHVYAGGLRLRRDFVVTIGNTVNGVGEHAAVSARRQRLVTDHEDVHVWQGRWFGPLYPMLYVGWTVVGGGVGAMVWMGRGRREPLAKVVETCGYYLNPFEWWAYSRDAMWPPPAKVPGLGWTRPVVRPLSEKSARTGRRRAGRGRPGEPR